MKEKPWCTIPVHPDLEAKIDQEDFKRASAHSWRITRGTTGRARVVTSIRTKDKVKQITLGKFLMNPPKGKQVYPRRFNDGLDYRKCNLIVCTLQERQRLLPKNRLKATSQYRGVSYAKGEANWRASIEVDGVAINLGSYSTEEEAALAYNASAMKHFGPSCYQNPVGRKMSHRRKE